MIVGVLGPTGSYSDKAAKGWMEKQGISDSSSLLYYDDISDTFSAVIEGKTEIGIVPIENSIEGSVGITLDLLLESDVTIIGEIVVPIEHCLLSRGKMDDIRHTFTSAGTCTVQAVHKDPFQGCGDTHNRKYVTCCQACQRV